MMNKGGQQKLQHKGDAAVDRSLEGLVNEVDQIIKDDGGKGKGMGKGKVKRHDLVSMLNIPINAKLTGRQRVPNLNQEKMAKERTKRQAKVE